MIPEVHEDDDKKRHGKLRFWAWVFSLMIVGVPVFYVVENWRGLKAFEKMQTELRAKGEPANFRETYATAIPDAENFFKQALVIAEINETVSPRLDRLKDGKFKELSESIGDSTNKHTMVVNDFVSWLAKGEQTPGMTQKDAALRILEVTKPYHERMNQLPDILVNRQLQLEAPENDEDMFASTHATLYQRLTHVFRDRSELYLLAGETEKSFSDQEFLELLSQKIPSQQLVDFLIKTAIEQAVTTQYWLGLKLGVLDEGKLTQIAENLEKRRDLTAQFLEVLINERASAISLHKFAYDDRKAAGMDICLMMFPDDVRVSWRGFESLSDLLTGVKAKFCPRGWILCAATIFRDDMDSYFLSDKAKKIGVLSLETKYRLEAYLAAKTSRRKSVWMSFYPRVIKIANTTLAERNLAQAAVAVARYELAEGKLPAALSDLCPKYLATVPLDPFSRSGAEIFYEAKKDGTPKFWSIGVDELDQGGLANGKSAEKSADIVWQYTK